MRTAVHLIAFAIVAAAIVASPSRAAAQDLRADLTVGQKAPKKDEPPEIYATVYSPSAPPAPEKIKLIQANAKTGDIELPALSVRKYVEGEEPVTVVVVFEVQHLWIGNADWIMESTTPDERNKSDGYHKNLIAALNELATAGPSGSKAAFISYGDGAKLLWSGDLKDANGKEIGTTKQLGSYPDPSGKPSTVLGQDVAAGIGEAMTQFKALGGTRKVLVLLGDGRNSETLGSDLKNSLSDVEVYMMHLTTDPLGHEGIGDASGWKKFANKSVSYTLTGGDDIVSRFKQLVGAISDRYYVTFPGADIKGLTSFDWDGKKHEFTLKVEKAEAELDSSSELAMNPVWVPPWKRKKAGWPWYLWLGIILGPILLIVLLIAVLKKKPQPEPEPVMVAPAPVIAAPMPAAPAGPAKTVMLSLTGDADGFPIVGWIVPLNGANQFQTFKLVSGTTKIGTGGASHVVINDGYMSTEHCQVVMSPAGFTLVDSSTNGTYVNEKKIDKHELWDNDTILMGKTNFRFKSTQ